MNDDLLYPAVIYSVIYTLFIHGCHQPRPPLAPLREPVTTRVCDLTSDNRGRCRTLKFYVDSLARKFQSLTSRFIEKEMYFSGFISKLSGSIILYIYRYKTRDAATCHVRNLAS